MNMTKKDAANRYDKLAKDLARAVDKIADIQESTTFLTEQCKDNGDPSYLLNEALSKLAKALAATVNYAAEYAEEANRYPDLPADADLPVDTEIRND